MLRARGVCHFLGDASKSLAFCDIHCQCGSIMQSERTRSAVPKWQMCLRNDRVFEMVHVCVGIKRRSSTLRRSQRSILYSKSATQAPSSPALDLWRRVLGTRPHSVHFGRKLSSPSGVGTRSCVRVRGCRSYRLGMTSSLARPVFSFAGQKSYAKNSGGSSLLKCNKSVIRLRASQRRSIGRLTAHSRVPPAEYKSKIGQLDRVQLGPKYWPTRACRHMNTHSASTFHHQAPNFPP